MDILSDVFICGIQTLLITIICTIFESSRFDLSAKQILEIFLVYYMNVGVIVFAIFMPMLYWDMFTEFINELNTQGPIVLISSVAIFLLAIASLIILSCKILVKIRGKD